MQPSRWTQRPFQAVAFGLALAQSLGIAFPAHSPPAQNVSHARIGTLVRRHFISKSFVTLAFPDTLCFKCDVRRQRTSDS
jgi:hypothetical protein